MWLATAPPVTVVPASAHPRGSAVVAMLPHKQSNTQHYRDFVVHNYYNIGSYPCEIIFDWKDVPIIDLPKSSYNDLLRQSNNLAA
jgi:hypothetical protein